MEKVGDYNENPKFSWLRVSYKDATIASPFTHLTRKEVKFEWAKQYEEGFKELRKRLTTTLYIGFFFREPRGFWCIIMHQKRVYDVC